MADYGRFDKVMVSSKEKKLPEDATENKLWKRLSRKSTSLIVHDTLLNVLQEIQVFALLSSLGLYWPWPDEWLSKTYFVFLFNLDIWDFFKLQKSGLYKSVQNGHIASSSLPLAYSSILIGWLAVMGLLGLVYLIAYITIKVKHSPYLLNQIARLQRIYIIILQVLFVPFGVAMSRIFHCDNDDKVDVDNDLECYDGTHWVYVLLAAAAGIVYLVGFPAWMIYKIRTEMLGMVISKHEAYLQLKEAEYRLGLDNSWYLDHFLLFSSFKKYGVYFRPMWLLVIAILCILVASLHDEPFEQALAITLVLVLWAVILAIVRPYRVTVFSIYLMFASGFLAVDALLGCLRSSLTSRSVNVWLTPTYLNITLTVIQVIWLICFLVFLLYLIFRPKCTKTSMWPRLNEGTTNQITEATGKFIDAALRTRVFLEQVHMIPPLFVPAHEIGRQIHVINAYCREAEMLGDPTCDTLWDVLELLVNAHTRYAPKSLYAESVKPSVKATMKELHQLLPAFVQRLSQREYDYLMVPPLKQRLLLKMFCLSVILHNGRYKSRTQKIVRDKLRNVWKTEELQQVDDYYEDMYPEPTTALTLEDQDDTIMLIPISKVEEEEETGEEETAADQPQKPVGLLGIMPPIFTNLVFQDDESDTASLASRHAGFGQTSAAPPGDQFGSQVSGPFGVASRESSSITSPRAAGAGEEHRYPNAAPQNEGNKETTVIELSPEQLYQIQPAADDTQNQQVRPGSGQNQHRATNEHEAVLTQGAPEHTSRAPEHTSGAPEHTSDAPEHTSGAPEHTSGAPEHTNSAPQNTNGALESTGPAAVSLEENRNSQESTA